MICSHSSHIPNSCCDFWSLHF